MTGKSSKPWKMFLPLGGLLLLAAAWSLYWVIALNSIKAGFAGERGKLLESGITLSCGEETWGGYPFRFEWACKSPELIADISGQRYRVTASLIQLVALAYRPYHILTLFDGPADLSRNGELIGQASFGRAISSIRDIDGEQPKLSIEIPNPAVAGKGGANRLLLYARIKDGKLELAADAENVSITPPDAPPVTNLNASFRADTQAAPLLEGAPPEQPLFIRTLALSQDAKSVNASGELSLDAEQRLSGTINVATKDIDGVLDIVFPFLKMREQDRAALRSALAGSETQKPAAANVSLRASGGTLFWGFVPLAKLEPLF
jgi:hypothetical protein